MQAWKGWETPALSWRANQGEYEFCVPSLSMSKSVDYAAGEYPLIAVKVSKLPKKRNKNWK